MLNYYNYGWDVNKAEAVPFKLFVAKHRITAIKQNYMVDPNYVLATVNSSITKRQAILGLIVGQTLYFTQVSLAQIRSAHNTNYTELSRQYLVNYWTNTISLREILEKAGAKIVSEKVYYENIFNSISEKFDTTEHKYNIDIDLSPESLEKDTIINLLRKE
jgi:hypothetical protein